MSSDIVTRQAANEALAKSLMVVLLFAPSWASGHVFRHQSATRSGTNAGFIQAAGNSAAAAPAVTFRDFYYGHSTGRGIWKWSQALDAYQRHLAPLAGRPLAVGEAGVQSGGSIGLWKGVLGSACHFYGMDISAACSKFADETTTITIGDQGSTDTWNRFFASTASQLDAFVDDGSHQPADMDFSLQTSFPHLKPGGLVAIEDTNGPQFVQSFYCPLAAKSIASFSAQGQVASVHVYPLMLIVHKAGGDIIPSIPPPAITVDNEQALWATLPQHPGGSVAFANATWGSFLSEAAVCGIFTLFKDLHSWAATFTPPNCGSTDADACQVLLANTQMQNLVRGVHIYPTGFIVEVPEKAPVLESVRMGTDWLPWYGV